MLKYFFCIKIKTIFQKLHQAIGPGLVFSRMSDDDFTERMDTEGGEEEEWEDEEDEKKDVFEPKVSNVS